MTRRNTAKICASALWLVVLIWSAIAGRSDIMAASMIIGVGLLYVCLIG